METMNEVLITIDIIHWKIEAFTIYKMKVVLKLTKCLTCIKKMCSLTTERFYLWKSNVVGNESKI